MPLPFDVPSPGKFRDLPKRVATAAGLVSVVGLCLWGGAYSWGGLCLAALAAMWAEWWGLTKWSRAWRIVGLAYLPMLAFSLYLIGMWASEVYANGRLQGDVIGPTFWQILLPFFLVTAADIGAYFTGRLCSGPKLAPRISPGKTWSGLAGGVAAGAATAWLALGGEGTDPLPLLALGGGLSLLAQAGDLLESWIKRRAGVKDSGRLLPGHGGLLDRLDGYLFTAPLYVALTAS